MLQTSFWYPSPDLCLDTILSWSSTDISFDLVAWFLLWHALSTVEPLYRQVCGFPNNVKSIKFTTGGLQSSCRNISRIIHGNKIHLRSISSLIAKGLNSYVNKVFLFFICNKFANISKNLFSLCRYGVLCVDWWGFVFNFIHFIVRL